MRLTIAAIGRFKAGPERALFEHFRERLEWQVLLREIDIRGGRGGMDTVRREAERLEAVCPQGAHRIALDSRGKALSSAAFARHLGDWRDSGHREIAFLIGGADGRCPQLVSGCDLVVAYGSATWPHLMVRGMLMEQIYRAQQILAGHPYHRE